MRRRISSEENQRLALAFGMHFRDEEPATDQSPWQTIESAPKDGTKILLWDGHDCNTASWDKHEGWVVSCVATDFNYYETVNNPTHWQPLPAPPVTEKP